MILAETLYIDRQPIGIVRQDSHSGQIVFSPLEGKSPLPQRRWRSVDELKRAVIRAYQNEGRVDG